MPRLDKMFSLEVTPEQFLRNCSREELIETDLLLQSPSVQTRMHGSYAPASKNNELKHFKIEK